ncbi:hypothetical protein V9K67_16265 [Paraflavisolibacter sp. H34]|uniref:hypothetical protein n=1 Tax=Huijunlia imazamoxiresistens TaxID=3127457 RepID=UPI0030195D7F
MKKTTVIRGEMAGASALNTITQNVKMANTEPLSLAALGSRLATKVFHGIRNNTITNRTFAWTIAGDVLGTVLYQTLVGGARSGLWWRGSLVGLVTGLGAELLPRRLGKSVEESNRTLTSKILTIGWYLAGTMVASTIAQKVLGKGKLSRLHVPLDREAETMIEANNS